jgi:hypothetical protein
VETAAVVELDPSLPLLLVLSVLSVVVVVAGMLDWSTEIVSPPLPSDSMSTGGALYWRRGCLWS